MNFKMNLSPEKRLLSVLRELATARDNSRKLVVRCSLEKETLLGSVLTLIPTHSVPAVTLSKISLHAKE